MDLRNRIFGRKLSRYGALLLCMVGLVAMRGDAQVGVIEGDNIAPRLNFRDTPLEIVLDDYAEKTDRTVLKAPGLPNVNITLRSRDNLTIDEYLQAIETVLAMNGVALLPVDEKFLTVVKIGDARQEAMEILMDPVDLPPTQRSRLISQLITVHHIDLPEARKAVDALKHNYGQVHVFERNNSMLVTDTAANIERMMEVIALMDVPVVAREEPHIIVIKHTKASLIKAKLEEIIADAQREQQQRASTVPRLRDSGPPGVEPRQPAVSPVPGVIRPQRPGQPVVDTAPQEMDIATLIEEAERGIIRGSVKIVADDRTNILIIITRPENMSFFERIIDVLDVETAPDVIVRVIRLEFATAKDVAGMLNDLIGATSRDEGRATGAPDVGDDDRRSAALREIRAERTATADAAVTQRSRVGELSRDNIQILSDERTNSLLIMAPQSDLITLEEIIKDMDMMLSQVLIEAVIIEVGLGRNVETGFDWVQRSMIAYNETEGGRRSPMFAFAGGGGGGRGVPMDATSMHHASDIAAGGGLRYYFTFFDLNIDAILRMAASDNRTEILSSPIILTTDNREAKIDVSTERYFYKGKRYVSTTTGQGVWEDDVDTRRVGINLTVTPKINARGFVVMDVIQKIENVAEFQRINDADWPVISSRELSASIAVQSGETIVLGGLARQEDSRGRSMVPLIGNIPLLGSLFRATDKKNSRSEVIVFITPYVLDTPGDIADDAERRYRSLQMSDGLWPRGWSDSRLPDRQRPSGEATAPSTRPRAAPQDDRGSRFQQRNNNLDSETERFIRAQERRRTEVL